MDEHTYDVAVTKPATVCVGRDRELAELASRVAATATRGCQPTMSSRSYAKGGVLVPSEHHIAAFHEWHTAMLEC